MTDTLSLTGTVATPPRLLQTDSGLSIVTFRLASSQRRFDRVRSAWVDVDTNWYTITAFRQLAQNAAASLSKGDRVVVSGRLRIRAWESDDKSGTAVEVDAESLGPDLLWGTTKFTRSAPRIPDPGPAPFEPSAVTPSDAEVDDPTSSPADADAPDASRELVTAGGGPSAPDSGWHVGPTGERPF